MAALPDHQPGPSLPGQEDFLTVAEYAELGETEPGYSELQEGRLLMAPSPMPRHNIVSGRIYVQLLPQLPEHLELIQDVDVDLELVPSDAAGFARRPDLIIVHRSGVERVERDGTMLRAGEVLLAVEIVSPGSRRTDTKIKLAEYADAGIPYYWIVDLEDPLSLAACHLAGELGYQEAPAVTGTFDTQEPFPLQLELGKLR